MQQDPITPEKSLAGAFAPAFRLFRPRQPVVALGLAVNYLMTKPAFANLQFGEWSRILVGQINRGHYYFAADAGTHIQGFIGWALTTQEKAEDWVERRKVLSFQDSREGEYVIINAWSADTRAVHRFLVDELRKFFKDKKALYFKRFYKDGSVRSSRLSVNDFVERHIERESRSDLDIVGVCDQYTPAAGGVSDDSQTAAPARDGNIAILEEYDMAVQKNTLEAYQLFIMRHPSHANAELARQRIRILRGVTSND